MLLKDIKTSILCHMGFCIHHSVLLLYFSASLSFCQSICLSLSLAPPHSLPSQWLLKHLINIHILWKSSQRWKPQVYLIFKRLSKKENVAMWQWLFPSLIIKSLILLKIISRSKLKKTFLVKFESRKQEFEFQNP